MENKRIYAGILCLLLVWAGLSAFALFGEKKEMSQAERRPLAQFPALSADTLLSGGFMEKFESYTLDQFPLRDWFRQGKALFSHYVLNRWDNNGIYYSQGHLCELEYPLNKASVNHALERFQWVYENYLQKNGSTVFTAVIPDKGYYLAEANGYPAMDYDALFSMVKKGMPWATYIDLTDCLASDDYYKTDTHWRQERLLPAAKKLASAMGLTLPKETDFHKRLVNDSFYGVYYGQAALPVSPDEMYLMENDMLSQCRVYFYETGAYGSVYDSEKLTGKDPYEVFLSGVQSLVTVENPNAETDRELLIFRDSFGSSVTPLLLQDYARVTLIDIRYIRPELLIKHIDFNGQDVLFLYSALVLNKNLI